MHRESAWQDSRVGGSRTGPWSRTANSRVANVGLAWTERGTRRAGTVLLGELGVRVLDEFLEIVDDRQVVDQPSGEQDVDGEQVAGAGVQGIAERGPVAAEVEPGENVVGGGAALDKAGDELAVALVPVTAVVRAGDGLPGQVFGDALVEKHRRRTPECVRTEGVQRLVHLGADALRAGPEQNARCP